MPNPAVAVSVGRPIRVKLVNVKWRAISLAPASLQTGGLERYSLSTHVEQVFRLNLLFPLAQKVFDQAFRLVPEVRVDGQLKIFYHCLYNYSLSGRLVARTPSLYQQESLGDTVRDNDFHGVSLQIDGSSFRKS